VTLDRLPDCDLFLVRRAGARHSITGVIYNVLAKARLQQGNGESDEQYQARRAELIEESKNSKASGKLAESDEECQAGLAAKVTRPD
jgi:hypothetical protein